MFSQLTLCSHGLPEQISWPVKAPATEAKAKPWFAARLAMAALR